MEYEFNEAKNAVLDHLSELFEEIENELLMSHQEKYALLEDMLENASDVDELKVAFYQWYADHAEDLEMEEDAEDIWDQALAGLED
jgi:hypothetical protein